MRQSLILLNVVHFALLYLLQIHLVSDVLDREGSLCREILLQLGMFAFFFRGYYIKIFKMDVGRFGYCILSLVASNFFQYIDNEAGCSDLFSVI